MIRHYKRLQYGEHKKYNFYTPDTNRKHLKILILIYNTIKVSGIWHSDWQCLKAVLTMFKGCTQFIVIIKILAMFPLLYKYILVALT